jgi:hypothetical protein
VNGEEVDSIKLKIGMTDLGSVKLELIELIDADGHPHVDFLKTHGEGLQHLGFYSENCEEWKSYAQEEGMEILCEAEVEDEFRGRRRAFYMDSAKIGGALFEIVEAPPANEVIS